MRRHVWAHYCPFWAHYCAQKGLEVIDLDMGKQGSRLFLRLLRPSVTQ